MGPNPKSIDQPGKYRGGSLTQNGLFQLAVNEFKVGKREPEKVRVYEKIRDGIWVYNGVFELADAWQEKAGRRHVFKFRLKIIDWTTPFKSSGRPSDMPHNRMIPTAVKLEVWKRDKGRCVKCPATDNLHFDHVLPFSKGGTSLTAANIQILCARHNLQKRDNIE